MTNGGGYIKMAKSPDCTKLQIPPLFGLETLVCKLQLKNSKKKL
jgi:hypothetical protein